MTTTTERLAAAPVAAALALAGLTLAGCAPAASDNIDALTWRAPAPTLVLPGPGMALPGPEYARNDATLGALDRPAPVAETYVLERNRQWLRTTNGRPREYSAWSTFTTRRLRLR